MADETKKSQQSTGPTDPATPGQEPPISKEKIPDKPVTAESQKIAPGKAGDTAKGADPTQVRAQTPAGSTDAPPKPAAPGTPGAPATTKPPAPGHAAKPGAPAVMASTPWESEMTRKYKAQFGSGVDAQTYMGQNFFTVDSSIALEFLRLMRDDEQFDYLVDVTAVHYPQREKQFDVVWILYSFPRNERIRVKAQIKDGESIPSAAGTWPTADWLEREAFDMFGIRFEGHPDLRRILLPDGWKGHPLRKDYGIIEQDTQWVQINLGIESGQ